ncbi:MAG: amino acid ABC transporter permease [Oscillospiraceae bacterium]
MSKLFSFQRMLTIFIDYRQFFLDGVKTTIMLSLVAVLFGTILGGLLAVLRMYGPKIVRWIAVSYIEIIRSTPLMVQVMIIYTFTGAMGFKFPPMFGIKNFSTLAWGLLAVSMNSAAYVAEIVRGGINAVDPGQMEAARCLGMNKSMALRHIILPQAIKNILPSLANEFVTMIKETSILNMIGVGELMFRAGDVVSITYRGLEAYVIAAILYFIIVFPLSKLVAWYERRLNKSGTR